MRALVAEENNINRTALRTVLERRGFVVDERSSTDSGTFAGLPEPPDLAILSAHTVLLEFASACTSLRAANPDVYIAALIENDHVHEAASVLEAGANDFLISSPLLQKLDARLSVICAQLYRGVEPEIGGDGAIEPVPDRRAGPRRAADPSVYDYAPVPDILVGVLRRLGLSSVEPKPFAECGSSTALSGWFPLLVRRGYGARWINLRFDFDRASIHGLFRAAMNRPATGPAELKMLVHQILGLVRDGLDSMADANETFALHFPALPQVFLPASVDVGPIGKHARTEQRGYRLQENVFLRLTGSLERSRTVERALTQLRPFDVLASPIESAGERTLLREGIMLDEPYIDRIQRFAFGGNLPSKVYVFRPPGDTVLFLDR